MSLIQMNSSPKSYVQLNFRVEGMDCASCVGKIETALSRMVGISEVEVNFTGEKLSLKLEEESHTTAQMILKKINTLGFKATELAVIPPEQSHHQKNDACCTKISDETNTSMQSCCAHSNDDPMTSTNILDEYNVQMKVEGMDCASCIHKIETALKKVPEISNVTLNFSSEILRFKLKENSQTTVHDITKIIKNLGFNVSHLEQGNIETISQSSAIENLTAAEKRWWQSQKGKHVIQLAVLMGIAYIISYLLPLYGNWIFTLAVIIGVFPFAKNAFALARSGSPFSIEMLMTVASVGALIIGQVEEAAAVIFLFSIGELLESVAAGRARAGIKALASLVPKTALKLSSTGEQKEVPASSLHKDDFILVRPGDRVPADGEIIQGQSSLDESPVTGESIPKPKMLGDSVFAGSINIDGALQVKVSKEAADNTISRIIQLVEEAQAAKSPTARFIEKFSQYYTPAIMALAALIIVIPPVFMGEDWQTWIYRGLALLLIACPCALVLSTPAAIASGLAVGTRRGLLIKGGNTLETIGRVNVVAFDKTGTLTEGKPKVTNIVSYMDGGEDSVIALAAAIESTSSHPLAKAITQHAETMQVNIPSLTDAYATAGKAVHGTIDQQRFSVASPVFAEQIVQLSIQQKYDISALQREGKTVSVLINESISRVLGLLALRDEPRQDAQEGIALLKKLGVQSVMLTGDNRLTAQAIADKLDLDFEAELLPQDKLNAINQRKKVSKVAMVGDGINDAPALAIADVGIAMGGGTDVAIETADAALLKSRVTDVAHLIALSRATMANIHQNVIFALGFKSIFLVTTVMGVTGLWVAVLADTGATALVTLNALRLLYFKGGKSL